jgi:hypothetical protein
LGEQMSDEDSLAHYGVKGMKWGQRKNGSAPRVTRKQNRQMNREASEKFYGKKASDIYSEGKKLGDRVLIKTRFPGDNIPTITTGKEFTRHLERGGVMDIRATEIYARQPAKGGQYVLNDAPIGSYQKQNFRNS